MTQKHFYDACGQVITIYHPLDGEDGWRCVRIVARGVYLEAARASGLDSKRNFANAVPAPAAATDFLLVLPLGACEREYLPPHQYAASGDKEAYFTLASGDRICRNEGPEIRTMEEWGALLPAVKDDVWTVGMVRELRGPDGHIWHLEAGARQ